MWCTCLHGKLEVWCNPYSKISCQSLKIKRSKWKKGLKADDNPRQVKEADDNFLTWKVRDDICWCCGGIFVVLQTTIAEQSRFHGRHQNEKNWKFSKSRIHRRHYGRACYIYGGAIPLGESSAGRGATSIELLGEKWLKTGRNWPIDCNRDGTGICPPVALGKARRAARVSPVCLGKSGTAT